MPKQGLNLTTWLLVIVVAVIIVVGIIYFSRASESKENQNPTKTETISPQSISPSVTDSLLDTGE